LTEKIVYNYYKHIGMSNYKITIVAVFCAVCVAAKAVVECHA
jgi:hypothetical protein